MPSMLLTTKIVLFYTIFIGLTCAKVIKVECPTYCNCDDSKSAECLNKKLIVVHLDLPQQTEILNISFNQISRLKDYAFSENHLLELRILNISHNKLSEINVYAFDGLSKLNVLDLSYNVVHYVLPYWFISMSNLEELYLKGNNFGNMYILQKNAFNSKSLKILDLSESFINYIRPNVFKLPNLEHLNLSQNQLISISSRLINPMKSLTFISVLNNPLSCDETLDIFKEIAAKRRIIMRSPCETKGKFERIMIKPTITETVQTKTKEHFWIVEDSTTILPLNNIQCQTVRNEETLSINLTELPYTLLIITVLIYGILIGFICGSGVKSCSIRHRIKKKKIQNTVKLKAIHLIDEDTYHLTKNTDEIGNSTPVFNRK